VVEKQRWVFQSVVGVTSNFKHPPLKEKKKTLQVIVKLAWPLLGFVGFQKSENVVCFLSSIILRCMPLDLMR
jgi:hypothetical protein